MIGKINATQLEGILNPPNHCWVNISKIVKGDRVVWWDQDAEVVSVTQKGDSYYLRLIDPKDKKEKEFPYKPTDELDVCTTCP